MAVYDVDPFYADRFADFVNQKEKVPFTVMAFTTLERLKNYAMEHEIELLLINSTVPKEEIDRLGAARVVTLADGETVPVDGQYPSVYKYQATDNIMREVMACYCVGAIQPALTAIGNVGDIIGVYSPVNRCLKTSFALTAGPASVQKITGALCKLRRLLRTGKAVWGRAQGGFVRPAVFLRTGKLQLGPA